MAASAANLHLEDGRLISKAGRAQLPQTDVQVIARGVELLNVALQLLDQVFSARQHRGRAELRRGPMPIDARRIKNR